MNMRESDRNLEPATGMLPRLPASGTGWSAPNLDQPDRSSKVVWSSYWRSVAKRRWYVLAAALLLTAGAIIVAQSIQPVFRSTTTLLIESGKSKILSIEEVYNGVSQDREYYQTQVEILRSRDVALRTVIATKLYDEPGFDPRKPVRSLQGRIKDFFSPPSPQPVWTPALLAEATVGPFLGAITIEPVRLSQLVKISFDATDPELAAKVADATATSFIESDREARSRLNLSVTGLLQERLAALRDKLLQSEQELQKYRENAGMVSVSGSQGIAAQQMADISQRLVVARVRRTELESTYQQASGESAMAGQPGIAEARNRVSLASLRLEELTGTLGDQNPRVIDARAALAAAQRQLQQQVRSVAGTARAEMQAARDTERSLQAALEAARVAVQGVNRQEFQLGVLEREVQTNKQLYELLLSRTKETGVSTNLQSAVARIVDAAAAASAPLRPNKSRIVLMTLLLSLLAGAIVCILLDKLSNTIEVPEEAERRFQHPVLTSLPNVDAPGPDGLTRLFLDDPKSKHSEGIRTVRTNMLLSNYIVTNKLILVTSAVAGEGKTTFCTNLALAHAQTKRTLLIDCNMRDPQIGTRLGLPADAKGLSDLASGVCGPKDCVHAIMGSSLLVMPAGNLPVDPEEFLLSLGFQKALRLLASRVDIVLIDSPPVSASSDAMIIAQQVGDTIYIVKGRDTAHQDAQRGLEQLRRAGANVLGIVLTNVESDSRPSWKRPATPAPLDATRAVGTTAAVGA